MQIWQCRTAPSRATRRGSVEAWTGCFFCLVILATLATPSFAQTADVAPAVAAASVTVAPVASQEFIARAAISGTVVARQAVSVVPQISGYPVIALEADIGDSVARGDVLARLDPVGLTALLAQIDAQIESARAAMRQATSQITSARAQADEAQSTLTRTERLVSSGSLAQSQLDQDRASFDTAQAALASAQDGLAVAEAQLRQVQATRDVAALNLSHAELVAQVSGIVASRSIEIGDIAVSAGEPAFVIYRDGALEIVADVVETDLASITVGDAAEVTIAGLGSVRGTVRLIAPTVDATTRLGTVHITPSDEASLRAGLFAGGWVITETRQGLGVPASAVLTDATGSFVFVVNDGVLARTQVQTGLLWNGQREVTSGLSGGQIVLARAGAFFADGDHVTPITASTPAVQGVTP